MRNPTRATVLIALSLLLFLAAAFATLRAAGEAPPTPTAPPPPSALEESATIQDDPTVAPDASQSADHSVSFPSDI